MSGSAVCVATPSALSCLRPLADQADHGERTSRAGRTQRGRGAPDRRSCHTVTTGSPGAGEADQEYQDSADQHRDPVDGQPPATGLSGIRVSAVSRRGRHVGITRTAPGLGRAAPPLHRPEDQQLDADPDDEDQEDRRDHRGHVVEVAAPLEQGASDTQQRAGRDDLRAIRDRQENASPVCTRPGNRAVRPAAGCAGRWSIPGTEVPGRPWARSAGSGRCRPQPLGDGRDGAEQHTK